MRGSLDAAMIRRAEERLRSVPRSAPVLPGRQPVHTLYGGAHLFRANTPRRMGELARREIGRQAPDAAAFAKALGLPGSDELPASPEEAKRLMAKVHVNPESARKDYPAAWFACTLFSRMMEKLEREPVEDFRIDFEDGYGMRPDEEEDAHAESAARAVAEAMNAGELCPFIGIRIKPVAPPTLGRALRTVDIFLGTLAESSGGRFPANFAVTLPKVTSPEETAVMADICDDLEPRLGMAPGAMRLEIMVETTQAIVNSRGEWQLPKLVEAARGRLAAAHFGAYDYTAACGIAATHQDLLHPTCDFARHAMQAALGATGVRLCDGGTNVLPVPVHRDLSGTPAEVETMQEENRAAVHRAWRLHYERIRHGLSMGFYQGWDLHPAQLPARYAAVYAFFHSSLNEMAERLKNLAGNAARATQVRGTFDDAATGLGLLNFFRRALDCGAIHEAEALALTGLSPAQLRASSFAQILADPQS